MHGHIDPLIQLTLTQKPPFCNNSQPLSHNLSPKDPLFDNILSKIFIFFFKIFVKNVSKIVLCGKIFIFFSNSHC